MKKHEIFGILVFAGFIMLAFAPVGYVSAGTSGGHIVANYEVVRQYNNGVWLDYKKIVSNSIGDARGYVFMGTGGALGDRVVFVELVRHNSDWRIDSHGYKQYILAWHNEHFINCNCSGAFSPYPRNGGKGYDNVPYDIHNSIGTDEGAYVDVNTAMKYDNWYVYQGNSGSQHWIWHQYNGGEEGTWNGASIGGAFYFGSSNHQIEIDIVEWKVVSGWWFLETHKTLANNANVYLNTS